MFDTILRGGTVLDGPGRPAFPAAVGITGGPIPAVGDLSAAVTGVLLACVCPVTLPYWMLIVGNFFAIFLVKQLYGGIGCNFLNPELAGRAFLLASYAAQLGEDSAGMDRATAAARLSARCYDEQFKKAAAQYKAGAITRQDFQDR